MMSGCPCPQLWAGTDEAHAIATPQCMVYIVHMHRHARQLSPTFQNAMMSTITPAAIPIKIPQIGRIPCARR